MSRSTSGGSHWKRKRNNEGRGDSYQNYEEQFHDRQRALAALHIQAHEADIVHSTEGKNRAQSLEVDLLGRPRPGTALIKLENSASGGAGWNGDEDSVFSLSAPSTGPSKAVGGDVHVQEVWVDRYDARLLLDTFTLLSLEENKDFQPPSPTSSTWSDFPEDSPGTFFLNQEEADDYHRAKRRRMLDEAYERRLKEREEEDEQEKNDEQDEGDPTEEALILMRRTATHLLSAANPAQLEMRILANHGADERFSFLRDGGRWHESWLQIKAETKAAKDEEAAVNAKAAAGLGGIAGYGSDSDSDKNEEVTPPPAAAEPAEPPAPPPPLPDPPAPADSNMESEAAKEQKRARAREWVLSRRKEKESGV